MKKLLVVLTMMLVVTLAGCNSPADTTEYATQEDLQILQEQVDEMDLVLNNLVCSVGLNGQYDCYINEADANTNVYLSLSYFVEMSEKDYLDRAKFPDYIWTLTDEYVTIDELGNLLTQKYLGVGSTSTTGLQFKMVVNEVSDMTTDEFMARISMMIIELSAYDFYTIDSPELYIQLNTGGSEYIKVRMSLLVSDKYDLQAPMIWEKMLDTRIQGLTYDTVLVQQYYDQFVTDGTFTGYVLNYE